MSRPRPALYLVHALASLVLGASLSGCASSDRVKNESRPERPHVNQIELQEHVERFSGVLMARLAQSLEPLTSAPDASASASVPKRVRYLARRQVVLYF